MKEKTKAEFEKLIEEVRCLTEEILDHIQITEDLDRLELLVKKLKEYSKLFQYKITQEVTDLTKVTKEHYAAAYNRLYKFLQLKHPEILEEYREFTKNATDKLLTIQKLSVGE